jgi:hypothetical protein
MSRELFRPEAVAHHSRGRTAGRVLDLSDRAAARAFAALVVALALVTALALLVPVDESATGSAVLPATGGDAVLLLPVGVTTRLRAGQRVDLVVGGTRVTARLVGVDGPVSGEVALRRYGVAATSPAVVVARAAVPPGTSPGRGGATVVLARRSVAAILLRRG